MAPLPASLAEPTSREPCSSPGCFPAGLAVLGALPGHGTRILMCFSCLQEQTHTLRNS